MGRRVATAGGLIAVLLLCMAASGTASAAVTIGEASPVADDCLGHAQPRTYIQSDSGSGQYAAPAAGVITSWSYGAGNVVPFPLLFRVARPTPTFATYENVGRSQAPSTIPGQLNTYPTQISVEAGDVIGITAYSTVNYKCFTDAGVSFMARFVNSDPAAGTPTAYNGGTFSNVKLNVSAQLEPDADADGFGDETQDLCPSDASTHAACADPVPETTITKRPKAKTRKRRATLAFASSEPGSSFECSFDGDPFAGCVSPKLKTLGKGRHVFKVRAIDPAGQADPTPAEASWKVKKRKRKR